jgi:hypothetical protein
MSDEQDKLKLSLEPPKLFGRKKRSDAMGTSKSTSPASGRRAPADKPSDETPVEELVEEPVTEEPVTEEPVTEELEPAEPGAEDEPEPAAEPDPAAEPAAEVSPEPEPVVEPAATPEPATEPTPAPRPTPTKPAAKPAATTKPATTKPAASAAAKTGNATKKAARPRAKLAPDIEPEPLTSIEQEDAEIVAHADEPPLLTAYPAAAVTGVVVGLVMVGLTWLSLRGCEAIRDTASCGGGPGFVLLVATFVLCILLGSTMLKLFSIPDPGSSSFLAVGLVAVVSLLFLIDALDHWSMLIVIPVIGVAAYLASVWVTKTFVEPGSE